MKIKIISLVSLGIVLLVFGLIFRHKIYSNKKANVYLWNELAVEVLDPEEADKNIIAQWGSQTVSQEELSHRAPHLAQRPKKTNELEQIVADSDYFFAVLLTAQNILIEKLEIEKNLKKEIPVYKTFEEDFQNWAKDQNVAVQSFKPLQMQNIKMDFNDKYTKNKLRELLANKITSPFQFFITPPQDYIEWAEGGIASLGDPQSKIHGVFLCDMISPICFKSLHILHEAVLKTKLSISYRPASVVEDIYSILRIQVGICLAKIDPKLFWNYFLKLEAHKKNTEEPDLYKLSGADPIQMQSCMVAPSMKSEWEAHQKFYLSLWRSAMPVLIINGEPILGAFTLDRITELAARHNK